MKHLLNMAWVYVLAVTCMSARSATAQTPPDGQETLPAEISPDGDSARAASPTTIFKTMGGMQFWGDELFFGQWRIQRNVLSGHCRLLDPRNGCHALGSFEHCQKKLNRLSNEYSFGPVQGPVVITLHGLGRSRAAMNPMVDYLRGQGRYTVINVSYPSTRAAVGDHARALARIVNNLDQATEIHFVGHSLGCLVIRHYLADQTDAAAGRQPDRRIKRIVMLGPPNHGALAATSFEDHWVFRHVLGRSAQQIAGWDELKSRLATPACEFGIIAGGRGNDRGFNPMLPGDDDGTVTVAETRLAGADDFLRVDEIHTFLMRHPTVLEATLRFLDLGHFTAAGRRRPIDADLTHQPAETTDAM